MRKKIIKTGKNGRPLIPIDYGQLDALCEIQCTGEEIASFFDINYDTLNRCLIREKGVSFAEYFKLKGGKGKVSLRRRQWLSATQGNTAMQIFLGKNILGQADRQQVSIEGETQINVTVDDIEL